MRKKIENVDLSTKRLLSINEAKEYLSLGYSSVRRLAEENGAVIRIGKRVLYDRAKLDQVIDSMMQ